MLSKAAPNNSYTVTVYDAIIGTVRRLSSRTIQIHKGLLSKKANRKGLPRAILSGEILFSARAPVVPGTTNVTGSINRITL